MPTRQQSNRQSSDLPPKRQGKVVRHDVSKPLQNISLPRIVYLLSIFAVLFSAFYAYRITQWKAEVGGWWNLFMGNRQPRMSAQRTSPNIYTGGSAPRGVNQDVALEGHIHAIASILGMQPTDLAFALSGVVHQHVAPKTISSLSSSISSSASGSGSGSGPGRVVDKAGTVARAVEAIVGLDGPIVAD